MSIFGESLGKPNFVEELKIKWCTEFKLLGIIFDQNLEKMEQNYENGIKSIRKELTSWKFYISDSF